MAGINAEIVIYRELERARTIGNATKWAGKLWKLINHNTINAIKKFHHSQLVFNGESNDNKCGIICWEIGKRNPNSIKRLKSIAIEFYCEIAASQ